MHVRFRLFSPASFRWQGEFSYMLTGPSSLALSEPLPLPSTVIGALASMSAGAITRGGKPKYGPEEVCGLAAKTIGLNEPVFRGPYIPCTGSREGPCIALHLWRGSLVKIFRNDDKLVFERINLREEGGIVFLKGTALRMDSKVVSPHYLYTQGLLDPASLIGLGLETSVGIDVLNAGGSATGVKEGTIKFGGEMRVSIVSAGDGNPLQEFLKGLWGSSSWEKSVPEVFAYVVSPILISHELVKEPKYLSRLLEGKYVDVGGLELRVPKAAEVFERFKRVSSAGSDVEEGARAFRSKLSLLAPGFDMARRCLRPLHLAIMPGSIVVIRNKSPNDIFREGAGEYRRCLWGTLAPLPTNVAWVIT